MLKIPFWMQMLRWYALHSPSSRGAYRLAHWLYTHRDVPDIEVKATLDSTLILSLRLKLWVDFLTYCMGLYELYLARFFVQKLRPDSVVLDIGAYIGQYSLLAAKYAPHGHVIALEPNPETYRRLSAHISLNELVNVQAICKAVSDQSGRMEFSLEIDDPARSGLGQGANSIQVQVTTVDEVALTANLSRVDVIKIDAEGTEVMVLRGASETIARFRPVLFCEVAPELSKQFQNTHLYYEQFLGKLKDLNYILYAQQKDRLVPLSSLNSLHGFDMVAIPAAISLSA